MLSQSQADDFIQKWKSFAAPQGHLVSSYNELSSWALIYNLFADKLLGTGLVDDSVRKLIFVGAVVLTKYRYLLDKTRSMQARLKLRDRLVYSTIAVLPTK